MKYPRPVVSSTDVSSPLSASVNRDSELKLPITRMASVLSRMTSDDLVSLPGSTLKVEICASTLPLARRVPEVSI